MNLPENYQSVMPYIIVNDANDFLTFVTEVFEARLLRKHLWEDSGKIQHAEVNISGSTIMFSQATESWATETAGLFIYVENVEVTFEKALAAGGTEILPLTQQTYGKSGGITDPQGNTWWITQATL